MIQERRLNLCRSLIQNKNRIKPKRDKDTEREEKRVGEKRRGEKKEKFASLRILLARNTFLQIYSKKSSLLILHGH